MIFFWCLIDFDAEDNDGKEMCGAGERMCVWYLVEKLSGSVVVVATSTCAIMVL